MRVDAEALPRGRLLINAVHCGRIYSCKPCIAVDSQRCKSSELLSSVTDMLGITLAEALALEALGCLQELVSTLVG